MDRFYEVIETIRVSYELGEHIYRVLKDDRPDEMDILISPKHIGDTIFLCAFIREYKSFHNCRRVLMVVPESHNDFMHMFPSVDKVLPLDHISMEALQNYISIEELWNNDHIIYAHGRGSVQLTSRGIVFREDYKYNTMLLNTLDYLGLPVDSAPERMTCYYEKWNKEKAEDFGNAVLIMPGAYSYSPDQIPAKFWTDLIDELKHNNFKVYLNYNSRDCEVLIDGAEPLSTSFSELVELSRYFVGFVGLRSGICDLIAETNAKLIAIYPMVNPETGLMVDEEILKEARLYDLGRTRNIWNYQYLRGMEKELIEEVVSDLIS